MYFKKIVIYTHILTNICWNEVTLEMEREKECDKDNGGVGKVSDRVKR